MVVFKAENYILPDEEISIRKSVRDEEFCEHCHDFIEIVYIINGKGRHFVNSVGYNVQKGDIIFMGINDTHAFETYGNLEIVEFFVKPEFVRANLNTQDPVDILTLSLYKEFATGIDKISPFVSFSGMDLVEIEFAIDKMITEYNSKDIGYITVIKGYFHVLLAKIMRQIRKNHLYNIDKHVQKIAPEIIQYIEDNYFEKITLSQLSEKCFYNPTYFSRVFKETFGVNLIDYITNKRIKEAVKLIDNTNYSIEEICQMVGYRDTKHFYKMFKEKIGVTPGMYRKR